MIINSSYQSYINQSKSIASNNNISWNINTDAAGMALKGWNLTDITNAHYENNYLRDLGYEPSILKLINIELLETDTPPLVKTALSIDWQDFLKATTIEYLFIKKISPRSIIATIIRPIRVLATCAKVNEHPWLLSVDTINKAINYANQTQKSGVLSRSIYGIVKNIIDVNLLSDTCPLHNLINFAPRQSTGSRKPRFIKTSDELLVNLKERKSNEKLPEKDAFWELIRIIFTEKPKTFSDAIRFNILKIMVLTGMRVGEVTLLPFDCVKRRDYASAKKQGGIAFSIFLRHFAEKQQSKDFSGLLLYEQIQYVPKMFQEIIWEIIENTKKLTTPLRNTLNNQISTNRLLPSYNDNEIISVYDAYVIMTGNPFFVKAYKDRANFYSKKYNKTFDPEIFTTINDLQLHYLQWSSGDESSSLDHGIYLYFNRIKKSNEKSEYPLIFRNKDGSELTSKRLNWNKVHFKVGDIENYLLTIKSKIPDMESFRIDSGDLKSSDLLFLLPKRSVAEERNSLITDITHYYSVGIADNQFINNFLGKNKNTRSIFEGYSKTDEERKYILVSHSLRHLQNTELFRLGVSDSIISKRFNRRSATQSYVYDHRSLSEKLDSIELPKHIEAKFNEKSITATKLVISGKASGPLVEKFYHIQKTEGEDAAFMFLNAESDGFHATPYGYCFNSFTVEPCPKNLECFSGCSHLIVSDDIGITETLGKLEGQYRELLNNAEQMADEAIGKKNLIKNTKDKLDNIKVIIATVPGEKAFPKGKDLSITKTRMTPFD